MMMIKQLIDLINKINENIFYLNDINLNANLKPINNRKPQASPNTVHRRADDAVDENGASNISVDMEQFTLRDIDAFGDEEHKNEHVSPVDYEDDRLW